MRTGMMALAILASVMASASALAEQPVAGETKFAQNFEFHQPGKLVTSPPTLEKRWVPKKEKYISFDPRVVPGLFVIKFVEGSHVRLGQNGLYVDRKKLEAHKDEFIRLLRAGLNEDSLINDLDEVRNILDEARVRNDFQVDYLFAYSRNGDDLQFAQKASLEQASGEELADLDLYYVAHAKGFNDLKGQTALMEMLQRHASIEEVHFVVPSRPAQATFQVTPDLTGQQGYLGAAPSGLDGAFARTQPGGGGSHVKLIDVEYDWVSDHEDSPLLANHFFGTHPALCPYNATDSEHGTGVLGIIAAPDNGFGITGFAPDVSFGVDSVCRPVNYAWLAPWIVPVAGVEGDNYLARIFSIVDADAINDAAAQLSAGDVLLIEQHDLGPPSGMTCADQNCPEWEFVAVEYYPEAFDAIKRAAACGVIVVEAAGNGGQNLDAAQFRGRFLRSNRDSGAILVGASGAGDLKPAAFTSVSNRIDVFAWGAGVVTLGNLGASGGFPFNIPDIARHYTQSFGGTSSASALVAGAVASLQGVRVATGELPLTAVSMRQTIVATGTPSLGPPSSPIGVQPNLHAAIDRIHGFSGGFAGDGTYFIRSRSSGKVLTVDNRFFAGFNDGQHLLQFTATGGQNQMFRFRSTGSGGFFTVQAVYSNKCLQPIGGAAGTADMVQMSCTGTSIQQFRVEPTSSGFERIVSGGSGSTMVLDIPAFDQQDLAQVVQFPANGGANQDFAFSAVR